MAPKVDPHLMTTWAKRGFWLPADKLMFSSNSSLLLSSVPTSFHVALADPPWCRAMEEENDALIINNTWHLVPHHVGSNFVTGK
jgi:hypothetical protein